MKKIYILLLIYLILGTLLFKYYRYYAVTDIVPYLDIAGKYLNGDFINAVNGVWGVLISWLLIPFLAFGIGPFMSFKVLNLIIGGISLYGFWKLSQKFELKENTRLFLSFLTIPILISFALVHTTPDLLAVCILVYYLNIIFDNKYDLSFWNGVYAGLLGGLGYLAKHYIFYFILIHLLLSHLFHFFYSQNKERRKKLVTNLILSYVIFLMISLPWVGILSNKYGFFTIGTSMNYNHAWMSPFSKGHAPEYLGLQPPPNPTANSMWEDLTYYVDQMPGNNWGSLSSWPNFKYQVKLILQNLRETFLILNKFSLVLGPLIVLSGVVLVLLRFKKREILLDKIFLSTVVIFLFSSGYLLIRTSDRYIWIDLFLLLLIGGVFLEKTVNHFVLKKNGKLFLLLIVSLFVLSFVFTPVRRLLININQDRDIYDLSLVLKGGGLSGNIASNKNWSNTSILSYYLNTKYFGMPVKGAEKVELIKQLKKYKIDYYLKWGNENDDFDFENEYPAIVLNDLVVYKIKRDN